MSDTEVTMESDGSLDLDISMASLNINNLKKRRLSNKFYSVPGLNYSLSLSSDIQNNNNHSPDISTPVEINSIPKTSLLDELPSVRRSLRKRIRPIEIEKRRIVSKPKKVIINENNLKNIEDYYLDKKVKKLTSSLETIFEESKSDEEFMSKRKFRRTINFEESSKNYTKIKKRKMKAKAVNAHNRIQKKKLSIEYVIQKLTNLEN